MTNRDVRIGNIAELHLFYFLDLMSNNIDVKIYPINRMPVTILSGSLSEYTKADTIIKTLKIILKNVIAIIYFIDQR